MPQEMGEHSREVVGGEGEREATTEQWGRGGEYEAVPGLLSLSPWEPRQQAQSHVQAGARGCPASIPTTLGGGGCAPTGSLFMTHSPLQSQSGLPSIGTPCQGFNGGNLANPESPPSVRWKRTRAKLS